ncbi:hypothetical protein [Corallococcus silvisoli]|uniref:hypothetical protein n=1 Tax=Corallococcus silvisoli TaxID=2697031 RepID=UPI001378D57B|nr:hypothetical protein [Corallococcus silvisoli]NBD11852.1 hypothetical protein [Corallococcus silvisoli]
MSDTNDLRNAVGEAINQCSGERRRKAAWTALEELARGASQVAELEAKLSARSSRVTELERDVQEGGERADALQEQLRVQTHATSAAMDAAALVPGLQARVAELKEERDDALDLLRSARATLTLLGDRHDISEHAFQELACHLDDEPCGADGERITTRAESECDALRAQVAGLAQEARTWLFQPDDDDKEVVITRPLAFWLALTDPPATTTPVPERPRCEKCSAPVTMAGAIRMCSRCDFPAADCACTPATPPLQMLSALDVRPAVPPLKEQQKEKRALSRMTGALLDSGMRLNGWTRAYGNPVWRWRDAEGNSACVNAMGVMHSHGDIEAIATALADEVGESCAVSILVKRALERLWPALHVTTPEQGAAVSVLRAAYPELPVPEVQDLVDGELARRVLAAGVLDGARLGAEDMRARAARLLETAPSPVAHFARALAMRIRDLSLPGEEESRG